MNGYSLGVAAIGALLVLSSCGDDSTSSADSVQTLVAGETESESETESEAYAAASFSNPTTIDNVWMPLTPGTRLTYEGTTLDDGEYLDHTVITVVTDLTKVIDGVETLVIWDQDFSDGELVETELAFFVQDDDGNVWRMGEYPEEYEEGEIVEAPAWLVGLEDAVAGVAMMAEPQRGTRSYSQGWGPEVDFIDRGVVFRTDEATCVPVNCYVNVVIIDEFNVDEPGAFQQKYFASGVGNVRVGWRGADEDQEELELVEWVRLSDESLDEARAAAFALEESAYEQSDLYGETEAMK